MRVAFVAFDFGEYCVRLASALSEHMSVSLFLASQEAGPHLHLLNGSVDLHLFHAPRLREADKQVRTVADLIREVKKVGPDLVHLQSGHLWFNLALPMLRKWPLVSTVHDPSRHLGQKAWKAPNWIFDRAYYQARQRIVHAPQIKEVLLQRLQIPADTVHVIPHIVLGDDQPDVHAQNEEHIILFFGRLYEYKGLEYLIQAEPLITARVPEAKIVIAGTGQEFEHYRRMMVNPDRFVVYNEYVSDEKRAELFRSASIVVLPYVEASQSGVIPIAYRFGKPVVATTVGGLPASVSHGETGYLVPPRDSKALAEAVVRLLQDRDLRKRFGESGRRKVNAECAPELVAEKTCDVYRQAIDTPTSCRKDRLAPIHEVTVSRRSIAGVRNS